MSKVWRGSRCVIDTCHSLQCYQIETEAPEHGPIASGIVLFFASVYLSTLLFKAYFRARKMKKFAQLEKKNIHKLKEQIPGGGHSLSSYASKWIASLSSSSSSSKWDDMVNFSYEDVTTFVLDNSATGHVVNDAKFFIQDIEPADNTSVASTIGKDTQKPLGKATAQIAFKDDDGTTHSLLLQNAYYFPDSPVNILSVTALAHQLEDDTGTWIQTLRSSSIFTWDHDKYTRTIFHPVSGLPELPPL